MKILVTGGPVYAKIDAVKLVTNRFRGGLMAKLVSELATFNWPQEVNGVVRPVEVTSLCSAQAKMPTLNDMITPLHHDGFHDYREKVRALAPEFDAIVLGAAVANLIPVSYHFDPTASDIALPLQGKVFLCRDPVDPFRGSDAGTRHIIQDVD